VIFKYLEKYSKNKIFVNNLKLSNKDDYLRKIVLDKDL